MFILQPIHTVTLLNQVYLVLEYAENGPLMNDVFTKPIAITEAWEYFRQLILGVDYLHHNGVSK